jgi:hypothetical protein
MASAMPELSQNTVSGRVFLKESGVGIPRLLVVLSSLDSTSRVPSAPPASTTTTSSVRLISMATGPDGSFAGSYEDNDFKITNPQEKRPNLQLTILAPEEPGRPIQELQLFSSVVSRDEAGHHEEYVITLGTDLLQKFGIPVPSEISQDLEPAKNVVGRLNALVDRQKSIVDGAATAARQLVDGHRERVAAFHTDFKPDLVNSLSQLPTSPLDPARFVGSDESVFTKSIATVQKDIEDINARNPAKLAPVRGLISLTTEQSNALHLQADANGTVSASDVEEVIGKPQPPTTTYVQAIDRLPLCRPTTSSVDCTESILNPSPSPTNPPNAPGASVTTITSDDVPRYLARLMEPLTAPEEQLVVGLMPVANHDTVQSSVQSFDFSPSPADVPAFHDFNSLQIAFRHVWQEAIDQGILDLAQSAYETIVELGGSPNHPDHKALPPVRALAAEANLVIKAHAAPNIVVRDHRGEPPGTRVAPPPATPDGQALDACSFASGGAVVRDHRSGADPSSIANPVERLPALLEALNKKLLENYNFTIYAANTKERSVNFGILNTFRQIWTPLSYQAGPLVKTIPLAPKQSQKLVITRKVVKKRAEKELENNLRVLKEESSQTNRADQEIANRASLSTNLTTKNEAKASYEVYSGTASTDFTLDAKKSSDDIKKSFREAVFKTAQEFKNEKTTEINTEESSEFDSVETTEISNPNDEIAVTFLFYELQRRYRLFERLYRVQPVVLVAQEFPRPSDIDSAWLIRYDWILRRSILDDSFLPVLGTIAQTAGDEIALDEIRLNVNQQRCIVNQLRQELGIANQQSAAQKAVTDQAVFRKSGASDSGLFGSIEGAIGDALGSAGRAVGDVAGAVGKVGEFILGHGADNNANQQAMQDRADEAANKIRDLMYRLEREVTALNALTETYTKALREHNDHLTEIARLQIHVKDNIMYYMQAIWAHEPADQRFFRLHNTPVPVLTHSSRRFHIGFDAPLTALAGAPHQALPRFGGREAKIFPLESVTKFDTPVTFKPLSQLANLDKLLGFKGNYAIFPLYQSNALTDFMMDPYIDRATGQLLDPSDPLNWSLDEFSEYVCCLKKKLTGEEFQKLQPELQLIYQAILTNPDRNNDVLVVPTNSLFIEALPAEHTLLERFKLDHRMIDVKKAQAEAREKELDNVRRTARILAGERGDPHIDKKVLIKGGSGFVIPTGDQ